MRLLGSSAVISKTYTDGQDCMLVPGRNFIKVISAGSYVRDKKIIIIIITEFTGCKTVFELSSLRILHWCS